MLDVVDLFSEQDTRDELGLAPIRDALSGRLFPGTIVPQTRARYYLFVPWMYRELERKRVRSNEVARTARRREGELIEILKRLSDTGVIGRLSGAEIRRLPSNTYWPGLVDWGIFRLGVSQDEYHARLDGIYERRTARQLTDDGEPLGSLGFETWDADIPPPPVGHPETANFGLSNAEARYLQGRIERSVPQSMLAWLATNGRSDDLVGRLDYVWEYGRLGDLPDRLRREVDQVRCFSEAVNGAALLYNLLLSRLAKRDAAIERYVGALAKWGDEIRSRRDAFAAWKLDDFWPLVDGTGHSISERARTFVREWVAWVRSTDWNPTTIDSVRPAALVREREIAVKKLQSRFQNPRLLELWGGEAGVGAMDFRWRIARGILADILDGLKGN